MNKTAIILGASGLTGSIILEKLINDDRYTTIKLFSRKEIDFPLAFDHAKILEDYFQIKNLEMMKNKAFDAHKMITHRFRFDQTKEAFDLVDNYADGVMKAMIEF